MRAVWMNIKEVFSNRHYLALFVVLFLGFESFFLLMSEYGLVTVNFGELYFFTQVISELLISVLFSLFIVSTVYKYVKFSAVSLPHNSGSLFGVFLGVLVTGCPACSITLASYIGLAGIISLFPFAGLELKLLSVGILLYASIVTLRDLNTCSVKKK